MFGTEGSQPDKQEEVEKAGYESGTPFFLFLVLEAVSEYNILKQPQVFYSC
jgi:hypothetical protein